ncbi:uncharacterized protein LOC143293261 [Babylonia areolata]|uniref:uncharacterized protein LOC143293261 n=1 Tax=Babylonia areolata TaxID=304850 RepID=UPI003FD021ED
MSVFSRRPMAYKLGLFLLLFSLLFFLTALSSPYWYKLRSGLFHIHGGLWQNCVQFVLLKVCTGTYWGRRVPSWLSAVQALQCVGVVCLVIALTYAIMVNWIQRTPKHCRLLEVMAALASALALAGSVLFIVQMDNDDDGMMKMTNVMEARNIDKDYAIDWTLGLNIAAATICLIATITIAIHNSSIPAEDPVLPTTVGYIDPMTGGVYPMIDVAGQEVYYIPQPQMMGEFQPVVSSPCQPPPYDSALAPPPQYSAVSSAQYSAVTSSHQYSAPVYSQCIPK